MSSLNVYESTDIKTTSMNGDNIQYTYTTGDGRVTNTRNSNLSHIFTHPGVFNVSYFHEIYV